MLYIKHKKLQSHEKNYLRSINIFFVGLHQRIFGLHSLGLEFEINECDAALSFFTRDSNKITCGILEIVR